MIQSANEKPFEIGVNQATGKHQPITGLSIEDRKSILNRALKFVPFFNIVRVPIATGLAGIEGVAFRSKTRVDIDFFLTEIRSNNSALAFATTGFNIRAYLASSGYSVYGYNRNESLPVEFVATDVVFDSTILTIPHYDDRQRESIPYLIARGDEVIVEMRSGSPPELIDEAQVVLCGLNAINYPYLTPDETIKINKSLDKPSLFQTFTFDVDKEPNGAFSPHRFYNIANDNTPRLILGFAIVEKGDAVNTTRSQISILDSTRHIQLTNEPIPNEFLAPHIQRTHDTHLYYLPIEHYLMPFGNMRFLIEALDTGQLPPPGPITGYQFVMLTRTV